MRSLATSLVVHGLLALLLLLARSEPADTPPADPELSFEIAELEPTPPDDLDEPPGDDDGASGAPAAGPRHHRTPAPSPALTSTPKPRPLPIRSPPRPPPLPPTLTPSPSPILGSVTGDSRYLGPADIKAGGGEGGAGLGGRGGARGRGVGRRGSGRSSATKTVTPEPKRSRARPPTLIYPKRYRPDRPGEVFVVLLTVDTDGYVDGVRLVRGVNPHDDAKALDAVWRFRYAPALDDRGRPRRATVRQRFMLER